MNEKQVIELARQVELCRTVSRYEDWIDEGPGGLELKELADLIIKTKLDEIAKELLKGPVNDTAASIAIWIREQA